MNTNNYESDASPYILFDVCNTGDIEEELMDLSEHLQHEDDSYYCPEYEV